MAASTSRGTAMTTRLPSSLLLCEALGFAPQLLLDDIINIANNAVQDGVNGMEGFLVRWVEERAEKRKNQPPPALEPPAAGGKKKKGRKNDKAPEEILEEDLTQEVEQGLVAFQTLLEHHTDIAFDFFEAWSLRNIFYIPEDLEQGKVVVLPHYEGADLTGGEGGTEAIERHREQMEEIEELRKRLDEQRRLTRLLKRGLANSRSAKQRAQARFNRIAALLGSESLSTAATLPESVNRLYEVISALPPIDPSTISSVQSSSSQDGSSGLAFGSGKRPWEVGTSGYVNWAVNSIVGGRRKSIAQTEDEAQPASAPNPQNTVVDKLQSVATFVGSSNDMRDALAALDKASTRTDGDGGEGAMELD